MRPPRRRDALAALLVGAAVAAPRVAPADDPAPLAGGGALRVSAEPPRLVLGRDAAADLRIAAGAEVEDVSVSASAGRVDGLRRVPGGFVARYRPPGDRIPQVAIVAALGRTSHGTEYGWTAVPLSGQGDARVRTRPGQEITLHIGEQSFGPRRAGDDGVAVIPVVVPPGVRAAHHGFRPIDLHVPETPLLHAVAERTTALADRPEKIRVVAFVVAPHGAARRGDAPVFEPSRGSVTVAEKELGAVEATWTLPPGRTGEERLLVRLQAAPASRAVVKVETVAGPPAVVAVAFDHDALVAGGEPVYVTARALDAAGNPVRAGIGLAAEGGELADVHWHEAGEVQARVRAGPEFGGRTELRVTAAAVGAAVSGTRTLPLRPGEPAVARFAGVGRALRGDGATPALLRVEVADRHGNPVAAAPAVTAARGAVISVAAAAPGVFEVAYVAPAVAAVGAERLVATAGAAQATVEPLLLGPAPGRAVALQVGTAADVRGRFAAPALGLAAERPAAWESALAAGLEPAWRAEVGLAGVASDAAVTVLGGGALSRAAGRGAVLHAGATAGLVLGGAGIAPAARLSAGATLGGAAVAPFVEASVLAAARGAPGAFAAVGVAIGVRLSLEGSPWRRSSSSTTSP